MQIRFFFIFMAEIHSKDLRLLQGDVETGKSPWGGKLGAFTVAML
jgi:hypothetical protein